MAQHQLDHLLDGDRGGVNPDRIDRRPQGRYFPGAVLLVAAAHVARLSGVDYRGDRNCLIAAGNSGNRSLIAQVQALTADPDDVVAEAALWALRELSEA